MNYKPGYLVDNVWWCTECGSLNAATREKCDCDKPNPKLKKDE